ncbi:hypothetical protein [Dongia soli]|uniref:hypothetical protein n=1 Tax=Dongia soli TaxID=600628 RepID=UPI003898E0CA
MNLPVGGGRTQCVAGHQLDLGLGYYSGQYLEALREAGTTIRILVLGLALIAPDVPIQTAKETFASIMSWMPCKLVQR